MLACYVVLLVLLAAPNSAVKKPQERLQLTGVMDGEPLQDVLLNPNEPWSFTVFGKNLPVNNWILTTRSSCQDLTLNQTTRTRDEVDVPLVTIWPEEESKVDPALWKETGYVHLRADKGVPFEDESREVFLICHRNVRKGVNLVVRMKEAEDTWWQWLLIFLFLCGSAFCSGTSIAFFMYSTDELLSIIEASIDPTEKYHAQRVLWFRRKSNYLICAFCATNCVMNVLVTYFCDQIFTNWDDKIWISITVSTALTVLLGEILPQGIGSRYGLVVASKTRYATLVLFVIMAPFAWPLSKLVDLILGREAKEVLSREQIKALLTHHANNLTADQGSEIIRRTVKFQDMTIRDILKPLSDVFALNDHFQYTPDLALNLVERGMYSRIPIFFGKNSKSIYGCINMSDLLNIPKDGATIAQILSETTSHLRFAPLDMKLQTLSEEMKTGQNHMCVVFDYRFGKNEVLGLVTSEDIWEQLFGDIQDDRDAMFGNKRTGFRKDQPTLDWYRDRRGPFTCNQQLAIIQQLYNNCPELRWMGLTVHTMRRLIPHELVTIAKERRLDFENTKIYVVCCGQFDAQVTVSPPSDNSNRDRKLELRRFHCDALRNRREVVFVLNTVVAWQLALEYVASFPSFPSRPPRSNSKLNSTSINTISEVSYFTIDKKHIQKVLRAHVEEEGREYYESPRHPAVTKKNSSSKVDDGGTRTPRRTRTPNRSTTEAKGRTETLLESLMTAIENTEIDST